MCFSMCITPWPHSSVYKVFVCRYVSDCRSRGHEFDLSPVPYFHGVDHEIISMTILLFSANSRRIVVSYKYVHEVLVNRLVKLA